MTDRYKARSSCFDLIDVLFFNRVRTSPRTALLSLVPESATRILDVCAGTGSNSLVLAESRPDAAITALDLSADMLKVAEDKFAKRNLANVITVVADACNTGFDEQSFDVVVLSLTLHELDEVVRQRVLKEAKRILRDDGRMIVVEWQQPAKPFQRLLFSLVRATEPNGFEEFLRKDLVEYFAGYGFAVKGSRGCDYTQVLELSKVQERS